jgi:hypothetical protein
MSTFNDDVIRQQGTFNDDVIRQQGIKDLITLLLKLERDDTIEKTNFLTNEISIVNDIVVLCEDLLITKDGKCNYENMSVLENNNFTIFPIEVDSFGWLVAGVTTDKGIIVYG